jgi:hypothetical protein
MSRDRAELITQQTSELFNRLLAHGILIETNRLSILPAAEDDPGPSGEDADEVGQPRDVGSPVPRRMALDRSISRARGLCPPHARVSDWSGSSGAGGSMRARKTRKEGRCGILMLIGHCETTASGA